ncbi:MAG: lipopolysaccharide biosynthesis protein [Candidatus Thorarchaeota archaeon]
MSEAESAAARGATAFFGQSAVSGVLRVLNIMVLTRLLLQQEIGQVAVLGVIYGFGQFLGALGLNHAAPLVVPEQEELGRLDRIKGFLRRSVVLIIITTTALVAILLLLAPLIAATGVLDIQVLMLISVVIPFSSLEVFLDSFLLARYEVRRLALGRVLFDTTRVVATVGLVMAGAGVAGVVVGWFLGELLGVTLYGSASVRSLPVKSSPIDMRPVLAFALPALLFQAVDVTIQNTDRIILLTLTDLATLGVYDIILGVLFMMSFVSLAVSTSLYPVLTRVRVHEEIENGEGRMDYAVGLLLRYVLLLLVPVAMIGAMNSHILLDVLFGAAYSNFPNAALSFSLLILAYAAWGIVYALYSVLRSMGEAAFFLVTGLAIIVFEVLGCWYLTSLYGLLGSAIVRCAYVFLLLVASLVRVRQRGIRGLSRLARPLLKVSVASILSGLFVLFMGPRNLLECAVWCCLGLLIYAVLLLLLREVRDVDFRVARHILPTRLHGVVNAVERVCLGETALSS